MAEIDILIEMDHWNAIPDVETMVETAAIATLEAIDAKKHDLACIAIMLGDDAALQRLNAGFRGKDKPTNVLSFPAIQAKGIKGGPVFLGDIALSYDTCVREAIEEGKPLVDHMRHLVVHGVLHLLGFDHETDRDAEVMEAQEVEILARLGIADPYSGAEEGATK